MEAAHDGESQRGRYPDGRKRRWTRAQKSAAKRVRIEELLAVARTWREPSNASQSDEARRGVPTRNGVGKWIEDLPWELWEVIFEQLNAIDCLQCVTSSKKMMTKYQEMWSLAGLRRQARDAVQEAREEAYAQQIEAAVDY